jgi:hypothetical protein
MSALPGGWFIKKYEKSMDFDVASVLLYNCAGSEIGRENK